MGGGIEGLGWAIFTLQEDVTCPVLWQGKEREGTMSLTCFTHYHQSALVTDIPSCSLQTATRG